jgi:thiol-disulfide isomerase/thioredoxin
MNIKRALRWTVTMAGALVLGLPARADTVHLATGKIVKGRVVSYANSAFSVEDVNQRVTSLAAAGVTSIDFERKATLGILETHAGTMVNGKVWLYDKGIFHIENAEGETERVNALNVTKATFVSGVANQTALAPKKVPPAPVAAASDTSTSTRKVARINNAGASVDVSKSLVAGKVTIVDFYADWCGPCRAISPTLEKLAESDADVYLRKVDIRQWGSPVAEQYHINSIPRVEIYDRNGKLVDTIRGANAAAIADVVKKAKGKA